MTLEEARKVYFEIIERYGISHSDCHEKRADGKVKFMHITLDLKINEGPSQKIIDKKKTI